MKTCLVCHSKEADEQETCASCGEASWDVSPGAAGQMPDAEPTGEPASTSEPDASPSVTEPVDAPPPPVSPSVAPEANQRRKGR